MSNEALQSTRGFNVIFIHSSLDDAGLTTEQFRVFAHVARRASSGDCWEGQSSMAKVCRIHEDTLVKCLAELEGRCMLSRQPRPGLTTIWRILPPAKWLLAKNSGNGSHAHPPETKGGVFITNPPETNPPPPPETNPPPPPRNKGGRRLSQLRTSHEGNPAVVAEESRTRAFTDLWCAAFQEFWHDKYLFKGGQDGKAVKLLLSTGKTPEQLVAMARVAWAKTGQSFWACSTQAKEISSFANAYNRIITELNGNQTHNPRNEGMVEGPAYIPGTIPRLQWERQQAALAKQMAGAIANPPANPVP